MPLLKVNRGFPFTAVSAKGVFFDFDKNLAG
jgi:hypothetical protein